MGANSFAEEIYCCWRNSFQYRFGPVQRAVPLKRVAGDDLAQVGVLRKRARCASAFNNIYIYISDNVLSYLSSLEGLMAGNSLAFIFGGMPGLKQCWDPAPLKVFSSIAVVYALGSLALISLHFNPFHFRGLLHFVLLLLFFKETSWRCSPWRSWAAPRIRSCCRASC